MFVYNVKLNSKNIVKYTLFIISILIVIFFFLSLHKIFNSSFCVEDEVPAPDVAYLKVENYTNVLKSVYENLDIYVGQKICFSGYVYRNLDFSDNQFVLARDMLVEGSPKTLIVGFLCSSKDSVKYADYSWVEITGEITKGYYHGDIPIINVTSIKQIEKPSSEYAYPPDSTYIPTSIIY